MEELKLTIPEAQETLLLSQSSVYSWIDKGKLTAQDTPTGKMIILSRKEAEQIREFNLKSRRNKVAKQTIQTDAGYITSQEIPVLNAEIMDNESEYTHEKPTTDVTMQLIGRIEELALEAGRFKQLEILRNEEKENVKFWQEKYHELKAELSTKDYQINALNKQIEELLEKVNKKENLFSFLRKRL